MIARCRRSLLALAALLPAAPALAVPIAPEAICDRATGMVNPVLLRSTALEGVNITLLDADLDGQVSSGEIFEALTDSRSCGRFTGTSPDEVKQCRVYKQTLVQPRGLLRTFARDHPGIAFDTVAPYPEAQRLAPSGDTREAFAPLLDLDRRYVAMRCTGLPPAPTADAAGTASPDSHPPLNLGKFLLTREIAALTLPRSTSGQLKNIPPAEINYTDDKANKAETFEANITVGLRYDIDELMVIPFANLVRQHVEDKTGTNPDDETSKLALGVLVGGYIGNTNEYVEATPLYVHDFEDGNEVIGGRLNWRPGFLYAIPSFQRDRQFLCGADARVAGGCAWPGNYFAIRTDAQAIASFGHVIKRGNDPLLVDGKDYLRVGPDLRMTIYGLRGPVDDFALQVGWRRLFRLSGDRRKVYAFTSSILYWVGGSQHVSVRYGYDRGRDEDTLEPYDKWTAGLGVRF